MQIRLEHLHPALDDQLRQVEAALRLAWEDEGDFLCREARRALLGRGKRLRPAIVLLAAECAGGANDDSTALAGVVEVVHAASLVHDDVMDGAASRRGIRSANAVWGSGLSVLVGDYLVTRAIEMVPAGQRERFLPQLSKVARHMCVGQAEEMRASGRQLAEEQYLRIVRLKTGSLFAFCGRAGAQTAEGSAETTAALERFGEAFGVAFQLADDILDFVGCDGRSGKPEGRDLAERKCTLPVILATERGREGASGELQRVLRGEQPSAADLQAVRELAEATGAIALAWSKVDEWREAARRELTEVPQSPARDALSKLCGDGFPMPVMTSAD